MEKLVRLSELYHYSPDYLLTDSSSEQPFTNSRPTHNSRSILHFHFEERKSERQLCGMPLWHIGNNAHGVLAIGLKARGVVAIGNTAATGSLWQTLDELTNTDIIEIASVLDATVPAVLNWAKKLFLFFCR